MWLSFWFSLSSRMSGAPAVLAPSGLVTAVVDDDRVARVLSLVAGLGDDRRDLLALEANLVCGQHGLRVIGQRWHPGQLVLRHELARDHRDHPRHAGGGASVDGLEARMRMWAAQDRHVQHARQREVVDVVALAVEEARVLLALDGLADAAVHVGCGHYCPPPAATASGFGALTASALIAAAC